MFGGKMHCKLPTRVQLHCNVILPVPRSVPLLSRIKIDGPLRGTSRVRITRGPVGPNPSQKTGEGPLYSSLSGPIGDALTTPLTSIIVRDTKSDFNLGPHTRNSVRHTIFTHSLI